MTNDQKCKELLRREHKRMAANCVYLIQNARETSLSKEYACPMCYICWCCIFAIRLTTDKLPLCYYYRFRSVIMFSRVWQVSAQVEKLATTRTTELVEQAIFMKEKSVYIQTLMELDTL